MPFKSQAQRRKFAEMMVKGEISPETFEEWNRETGSRKLPERVAKTAAKKGAKKSSSKGARKRPARRRSSASKRTARKRAPSVSSEAPARA